MHPMVRFAMFEVSPLEHAALKFYHLEDKQALNLHRREIGSQTNQPVGNSENGIMMFPCGSCWWKTIRGSRGSWRKGYASRRTPWMSSAPEKMRFTRRRSIPTIWQFWT